MSGRGWVLVAALAACVATPAAAQEPAASAATELLRAERIAALPAARRAAWERYLETSRRQSALDRDSMRAELRRLGRDTALLAPRGPNQLITPAMTDEWFRSDSARRIADVIVSFQTPSGGWSKRMDFRGEPRRPGQGYALEPLYTATFDNDATTDELVFLARAHRAHPDPRYRDAFLKGVEYTLRAQYPNGCWPQVYPLAGGYHDAATFNDDMMVHVLRLLRGVARGEYGLAPAEARRRADAAVQKGVECVLAAQVLVDGHPTVWGAQSDPLTLRPVRARAYEHPSLSGAESVGVMEFLMELDSPDPRVTRAVHAAADWFRRAAIPGYTYRDHELAPREGADPLWARFYEIGTDRPIFSDRDGIVRYRLSEVGDERRNGYAWYGSWPARALQSYETWRQAHPNPGTGE